ncbi:hypothetical protein QBC35DRAFT_540652 [Podospora australis]|uniref:Uncharacterized protein n=1 Tax=Podospora australis TaxID=1536484 RepID=A0AAN7AF27_9PEZI|nr:hypothetical protein QBC35DRAFT_540652 [Podospora australis]
MRRVKPDEGADGVFLWAKLLLDSLVKKDIPHINKVLANPPSTLDNMIWSVFDRISKDQSLAEDVMRKILLFMTHSRRPLLFGELYLITALPDREPNILLWDHMRGTLSSVFDLKFPWDRDPDAHQQEETGQSKGDESPNHPGIQISSVDDDDGDFDFSENDEDEEDGTISGDDDATVSSSTVVDEDLSNGIRRLTATSTTGTSHSEVVRTGKSPTSKDFMLLSHLSDGKTKTRVTFCHTCVRDYLMREGSPKTRQRRPLPIIPEFEKAHIWITITCLEILRLEDLSANEENRFLCDYPVCHFPYHLEEIDKQSIPHHDVVKIIEGLYWLFGTERGCLSFLRSVREYDNIHGSQDPFWRLWVVTDKYLKIVQEWFGLAVGSLKDSIALVSDDTSCALEWMASAAGSLPDLLQPIMTAASKMWLVRTSFSAAEYREKGNFVAFLLDGWLSWIEDGISTPHVQEFRFSRDHNDFTNLAPDQLKQMAEWAGLEQDVHWHTCLGWMLMIGRHYEEAIPHFKQAIELDAMAWPALEGLARSLDEHEQKYEEAIEWQEKAIEAIPKNAESYWISGYLWPRIAIWASHIKDETKADSAAKKGFEAEPSSIIATTTYLGRLCQRGEDAIVEENLEWLDKQPNTQREGTSWLTRLFLHKDSLHCEDCWDLSSTCKKQEALHCSQLGTACARQGRPQFVLDALDKALEVVDGDEDLADVHLWLLHNTPSFKSRFYGLRDEAVTLWEALLSKLSSKGERAQEQYKAPHNWARDMLAQHYFDIAVDTWESGGLTSNGSTKVRPTTADKLKELSVEVSTGFTDGFEGFDLFRSDYPAMLWGPWMMAIRQGDTDGLICLAVSLFHAGDRRNASAILAILLNNVDAGDDQSVDSQSDSVPLSAHPDGYKLRIKTRGRFKCVNCQRSPSEVSELHFCEVCPAVVSWCRECLTILKDPSRRESMVEYRCNPKHDFYQAWPVPLEAKFIAAGSLDGGVMVRKEWLESLRSEWWAGIPN